MEVSHWDRVPVEVQRRRATAYPFKDVAKSAVASEVEIVPSSADVPYAGERTSVPVEKVQEPKVAYLADFREQPAGPTYPDTAA